MISTEVCASFSFTSNDVTRASGIAAIVIERDDALEIGLELIAAEVVLLAPRESWSLRTWRGRTSTEPA